MKEIREENEKERDIGKRKTLAQRDRESSVRERDRYRVH